jgi:hypothetical protein
LSCDSLRLADLTSVVSEVLAQVTQHMKISISSNVGNSSALRAPRPPSGNAKAPKLKQCNRHVV